MPKYKAVLFDLDGTLNDSGPGILNSVKYALSKMNNHKVSDETLRRFIGPSLNYSFETYAGMTESEAIQAISFYRERYTGGEAFNLKVYDGIPELLEKLSLSGINCAVVTSKPHIMAEKIVRHFYPDNCFKTLAGPEFGDPSNKKSVLINKALSDLSLKAEDAVMVGDTRFDMIGANEAGCDSIGVTYGYGTESELIENNATYIVSSPAEIADILEL